jgi:SAM-dependent methyltransferase
MTDGPGNAWSDAARKWDALSSPLRPHSDDIAVVERVAAELTPVDGPLTVAVLGMTKEVIGCRWPQGTKLGAFDGSAEVIRLVWPPPNAPEGAFAQVATWSELPFGDDEVDVVTADGSLGCLDYPDGARQLFRELRRILRPAGRFVARTTLRPETPDTMEQIVADLEAGRIGNGSALRVRVGAALHPDGLGGFRLQQLWDAWQQLIPDVEAASRTLGWPAATLRMIEVTRANDFRITYPTLAELRGLLAPEFEEIECVFGTYELAEWSPTLVLRPR